MTSFRSTVCRHLVPDAGECPSCRDEARDKRIARLEADVAELRREARENAPPSLLAHILGRRWL